MDIFFIVVIIEDLAQIFIIIIVNANNIESIYQSVQVFLSLFLAKIHVFLYANLFIKDAIIIKL